MKITITESQYRFLLEQKPDEMMPGQIERSGYKSNDPNSLSGALEKQSQYFQDIKKFVNTELEDTLRNFLYSPEGIATSIGVNVLGGEPLVITLFSILVAYDINKWIDEGEPNWLFLITDLICMMTSGFAGTVAKPMINLGKSIKFKTLFDLFKWIEKTFPTIWTKFILPLTNSIGNIISKIISQLSKLKSSFNFGISISLPTKLRNVISNVINYTSKISDLIKETLTKIIGKVGSETAVGYAKYKARFTAVDELGKTKTGKKILKKGLTYINPLLGSDKVDPFLLDLIKSPKIVDLSKYKIEPIFLDNSKDVF